MSMTIGISTEMVMAEVRALAAAHNLVTDAGRRVVDLFAVLNEDHVMTFGQLLTDSYTDVAGEMMEWVESLDDPGVVTGSGAAAILEVTLSASRITERDASECLPMVRRLWERAIAMGMMAGITGVADPAGSAEWRRLRHEAVGEMRRQLTGMTDRKARIRAGF
ncbi:MAG: hypothetical protein K2M04_02320 [Muribaculaceae bacterium]|nr:hypothetical protein [Muribaculaceae bacterium]